MALILKLYLTIFWLNISDILNHILTWILDIYLILFWMNISDIFNPILAEY